MANLTEIDANEAKPLLMQVMPFWLIVVNNRMGQPPYPWGQACSFVVLRSGATSRLYRKILVLQCQSGGRFQNGVSWPVAGTKWL